MFKGLWGVLIVSSLIFESEGRCGDRLERALEMMQQRGIRSRRRYEAEDPDLMYHHRLRSAPIDVSVTKLMVEIPHTGSREGLSWAKVERCSYEPNNNSIRSRVAFSELAVTGLVQLVMYSPSTSKAPDRNLPAESCRMNLRLRRAGMEFHTSPIARGRGQMRIRTESNFLEPRFASIYAYGCRTLVSPQMNPERTVESEPRKREVPKASRYLEMESGDSNFVSNSSAFEDEDATGEENRLGNSVVPTSNQESANDVLLDSLWRSREDIAREMEDVFLRSASQAITHYIEKQLHPAIKETLMLSMGYTISYG